MLNNKYHKNIQQVTELSTLIPISLNVIWRKKREIVLPPMPKVYKANDNVKNLYERDFGCFWSYFELGQLGCSPFLCLFYSLTIHSLIHPSIQTFIQCVLRIYMSQSILGPRNSRVTGHKHRPNTTVGSNMKDVIIHQELVVSHRAWWDCAPSPVALSPVWLLPVMCPYRHPRHPLKGHMWSCHSPLLQSFHDSPLLRRKSLTLLSHALPIAWY